MPCIQTLSGLARDCSSNMGGILEVLIANSADVTGVTISEGIISTISMELGIMIPYEDIVPGNFNSVDAMIELITKAQEE